MNAETLANRIVNELKKADCDLLSKRLSELKDKYYVWYCKTVLTKVNIPQLYARISKEF